MRPLALRPPVFFSGLVKDFSGLDFVISLKSEIFVWRNELVVGLNVLKPILCNLDLASLFKGNDRLFPGCSAALFLPNPF